MAFNCTKCGACCKAIGSIRRMLSYREDHELAVPERLLKQFPYNTDEQGVCEHYDPAIGCKIYDNRPDICSVDRMFEIYYHTLMTRELYDKLQVQSCKFLIEMYNLDKALIPTIANEKTS